MHMHAYAAYENTSPNLLLNDGILIFNTTTWFERKKKGKAVVNKSSKWKALKMKSHF